MAALAVAGAIVGVLVMRTTSVQVPVASHVLVPVPLPMPVIIAAPAEPAPARDPELTCGSSAPELLATERDPVLCTNTSCIAYRNEYGDVTAVEVPRPAPRESRPRPIVRADRVCTGTRCDRLGHRLRRAIADVDPANLTATDDHAAIVIAGYRPAAWNRALDREISVGSLEDLTTIQVAGNLLIDGHACMEYCSASGRLRDANGRRRSRTFPITPAWHDEQSPVVAVGDDKVVVFGGFAELTYIRGGKVIATTSLLPEYTRAPHEVTPQTAVIDDESLAAYWCYRDVCHVTRISLYDDWIDLSDDLVRTACAADR